MFESLQIALFERVEHLERYLALCLARCSVYTENFTLCLVSFCLVSKVKVK